MTTTGFGPLKIAPLGWALSNVFGFKKLRAFSAFGEWASYAVDFLNEEEIEELKQKTQADFESFCFNGGLLEREKGADGSALLATETAVEKVTMAILEKEKDPSPGVNWECNRNWKVDEVRHLVRKALNEVSLPKEETVERLARWLAADHVGRDPDYDWDETDEYWKKAWRHKAASAIDVIFQ